MLATTSFTSFSCIFEVRSFQSPSSNQTQGDVTICPVEVVFNNKAMVYAGAGVCAVIGTLSPVCTAVISSCCGRRLTVPWFGTISGGKAIEWNFHKTLSLSPYYIHTLYIYVYIYIICIIFVCLCKHMGIARIEP